MSRVGVALKSILGPSLLVAALCAPVTLESTVAHAKESIVKVNGATLAQAIKPSEGFVDDAFGFDAAGGRLLYIHADADKRAEVVIYDVRQTTPLVTIPLTKFTKRALRAEFAIDGEHVLVWAKHDKTGKMLAALLDSKGNIVRKLGPATDIVRTSYEGQDAVTVYDVQSVKARGKKSKKGATLMRHSVSVHALATGKLLGKKNSLDVNGAGKVEGLDFELKYWSRDYTTAVGIKGGEWDAKEDQRSPDTEGWYVLPTKTFAKRLPISNIIEHAQLMVRVAKYARKGRTVAVRRNLTGIDLMDRGEVKGVTLDEPFHHYDSSSLVVQPTGADGRVFFTLRIDPVHPDAAARRRAVKSWLDLYELAPGQTKAVRRARILPSGKRELSWRANSGFWAVLPHHVGFDRGGPELKLYELK